MQITEIYKSIQGESTYAGLPCVFVRLTGCNLRCSWCDSEYTFSGGHRMAIGEVEEEVQRLSPGGRLVEITGGEPLLQEREAVPLMEGLLRCGYTVLLETSGERPLGRAVDECEIDDAESLIRLHETLLFLRAYPPSARVLNQVEKILKSFGQRVSHLRELGADLTPLDEVKFVLSDRGDYEFAREFVARHHLASRVNAVLFSPAFSKEAAGARDTAHCLLDPRELAEWMLADNVPARLGLQIHKFIWDPAMKGI